jgi:hypothetical protein
MAKIENQIGELAYVAGTLVRSPSSNMVYQVMMDAAPGETVRLMRIKDVSPIDLQNWEVVRQVGSFGVPAEAVEAAEVVIHQPWEEGEIKSAARRLDDVNVGDVFWCETAERSIEVLQWPAGPGLYYLVHSREHIEAVEVQTPYEVGSEQALDYLPSCLAYVDGDDLVPVTDFEGRWGVCRHSFVYDIPEGWEPGPLFSEGLQKYHRMVTTRGVNELTVHNAECVAFLRNDDGDLLAALLMCGNGQFRFRTFDSNGFNLRCSSGDFRDVIGAWEAYRKLAEKDAERSEAKAG